MIVATPLDLPKIEPDSWDVFWEIWNEYSGPLVKIRQNMPNANAPINSSNLWRGLDILTTSSLPLTWTAPKINIKHKLPRMHEQLENLPFKFLAIRLVQSLVPFHSHTDDNLDMWSVRAMFHNTDPNPQWFYTKPQEETGPFLNLPNSTNWFAYNDKHCWHGTIFRPEHPKILLQVILHPARKIPEELLARSMSKYSNYLVDI